MSSTTNQGIVGSALEILFEQIPLLTQKDFVEYEPILGCNMWYVYYIEYDGNFLKWLQTLEGAERRSIVMCICDKYEKYAEGK